MTRAQTIERQRLQRIIGTSGLSDFEYSEAQRLLSALEERVDPTCPHCTKRSSAHGQPICPVVASFRRRGGGRDGFPTETQASDVRRLMAEAEEKAERDAWAAELKAAQKLLF